MGVLCPLYFCVTSVRRFTIRFRSPCLRRSPHRLLRGCAEFDHRGNPRGVAPLVSLGNPKGVGQATPVVGLGAKPHSNYSRGAG
jgi:hypothetical protein